MTLSAILGIINNSVLRKVFIIWMKGIGGSMDITKKSTKLYRRRFVPDETIYLKDDIILSQENNLIITKWNTLKPRCDIAGGISAYYIDKGIKVSRVHNCENQLVYWYCDIINTIYEEETNSYIFEDLLIDVIVYENGMVHVVDLDEVGDLLENNQLETKKISNALHIVSALLQQIYSGNFSIYQKPILCYCEEKK